MNSFEDGRKGGSMDDEPNYPNRRERPPGWRKDVIVGGIVGFFANGYFETILSNPDRDGPGSEFRYFLINLAISVGAIYVVVRLTRSRSGQQSPTFLGFVAGVCVSTLLLNLCFAVDIVNHAQRN
jgi:hypothetical protein